MALALTGDCVDVVNHLHEKSTGDQGGVAGLDWLLHKLENKHSVYLDAVLNQRLSVSLHNR